MANIGVYIGRFSPMHKGHQFVINTMLDECDIVLLMIGSSASPRTIRTPFNYSERRKFVRMLYNHLPLIGIPDVNGDDIWIQMIDDILETLYGKYDFIKITFYGGSEEDVKFLYNFGKNVKIVDRQKLPINATSIRQMMMLGQDISSFVDEKIAKSVVERFQEIMSDSENW